MGPWDGRTYWGILRGWVGYLGSFIFGHLPLIRHLAFIVSFLFFSPFSGRIMIELGCNGILGVGMHVWFMAFRKKESL